MRVKKCEVKIRGGHELPSGHVEMDHGREYSVIVESGFSERSDAVIMIDGKEIGTWRIPDRGRIEIERPANSRRKLTFFKSGSLDAIDSGESRISPENAGLVSVRIFPEKVSMQHSYLVMDDPLMRGGGLTKGFGGVSGLGRTSSQRFRSASAIDRDCARAVKINLRIVCLKHIEPILDVRENPIPEVW